MVYLACTLTPEEARTLSVLLERIQASRGGVTLDAVEVVTARPVLKLVSNALERAEALP